MAQSRRYLSHLLCVGTPKSRLERGYVTNTSTLGGYSGTMVGGECSVDTESDNSGAGTNRELLERELRSEIKHSLASPIRGIAILADLLEEALGSAELDDVALREISSQLSTLTDDASNRLEAFASPADD